MQVSDSLNLPFVLVLFYRGGPMVYFKENYNFSRFQRGAGPTFSRGVQVLISIETYRIYDFPGEGSRPLSPLWIRTCDIGPSINGLVTDENTNICCRGFILALFQSTTAKKIDSEHTQDYKRLLAVCKAEIL